MGTDLKESWGPQYAHKSDAFSNTEKWESEAKMLITHLPEKGTVVDFACNTGKFIEMAQKVRPDLKYIGVDINEEALAIARSRHPEVGFQKTLEGIENVDMIFCLHALQMLQFPEEALMDFWKVLVRGGKVALLTNNDWNRLVWFIPNLFNGYKHDETMQHRFHLGSLRTLMRDTGYLEVESGYFRPAIIPWLSSRMYFIGRT